MHRLYLVLVLMLVAHACNSQVLISLLLGDKINSGKVEFGLDGGVNIISQKGNSGSQTAFNLGFYFDIKLKSKWMIHTGVIVKSTMGAGDVPVYSLNDPALDDLFSTGHIDRNLSYFNVPIMLKYPFGNNFYVEAGPMLGLLYSATDEFLAKVNGQDLKYDVDVKDKFHRFDAGIMSGIGYRLMKGYGMNLGVRYYMGLTNVVVDELAPSLMNRSVYFVLGIPIGAGKAK